MTTPRFVRHFTLLGLAVSPSLAFANPAPASAAPAAAAPVDFAQVQALLESKCLECHNPDKVKGKLLMNTAEAMIKGGSSGTSLVPGKPDESELLKRVVLPADHDDIMPPKGGPLAANEIDLLKRWIAEGAHWPQGLTLRAKSPEEIKALAELNAKLPSMTKLEIFPDKFALETKRDFHQVVVMATFADATTRDVTKFSNLRVADAKVASLTGDVLQPVADAGSTELLATLGSTTVKAPVSLNGGQKERAISFNLDVMPVFLRGGCNAGGCHGAARGKDGFRLSLFGMDPQGDYTRLTREMVGRRVNLAIPEESTLVEKAVGAVPHSGNQCYEPESQYNKAILEWISNGAQYDPPTVAKVTGIEVFPKQIVLEGQGSTQQITVRATYSDGSDRDVTKLALFMSNNDPTASINKDGLVTSGDRGAAFTLARFDVYSVTAQVLVIPAKLEYERPKLVENNYIDTLVNENLHKLRILPSGVCTDEEFVRRAYIDVIGIYPKPDEIKTFLADANPKKREALVDSLTQRKEFTEVWVMKWAELLQIRSGIAGNNNQPPFYKNALLYYNWLGDRIGKNVPLDEIVTELLSSTGGTVSTPAVNFYQTELDQLKLTENVAQVFMGMRIQCAQCHNHPFDRWTMDDYYGFKAFFSQIGRKATDDPQEVIIFNNKGGESRHFLTQAVMKPKFLGGESPEIKPGEDRRKILAEWIASPKNPYFARNISNIVWAHFFGLGIVDPVDDVRVSNPPSNPELLAALAENLTNYKYDMRRLVKDICTSMTYQRSTKVNETNAGDKKNFSHAQVRRVRAEILLDAISQITETPNKFQGLPLGARAVQIADGAVSNYFLTTFGRAKRESVCSCEVKMEPTLSQALHLMNGDAVNDRIKQGKVVATLIKEKKTDAEIIENLYLRVFGRLPKDKEKEAINQTLAGAGDQRQLALEDVFWALLNSKEFYFNH
ncbi:PSD1 and planctomycete cytochrome C domain-containing protein [Prosthecobacter algae]|uniref:PSD1 and planctomycete cytochrome C domain-containing protein n=1 Tax=Prosthecobacter algae TaxID=1144682 RepID=UPI0031E88E59